LRKLRNWWDLPGVMALVRQQFPTGHGSHATPSEIAITQWAYPDAVKSAKYAPQIAGSGPIREAADFRARHPDGRMGSDPSLATPEAGEALVQAAVRGLVTEVEAFDREPRIL
jgi:creatinine amidohydrolase